MGTSADRVVIITGAASGIGAATARLLSRQGAALLLHTRKNDAGLQSVAGECRRNGAEVETVLGDLADAATPAAIVACAKERFGRIDQFVANAGQAVRGSFADLGDDELLGAFAAMPMAFLRLVRAAGDDLVASKRGRVVVVSSFVAHGFGTNGLLFPATSAAKAALEALAKTLAVELAPKGVTVNVVVPGFTRKEGGGHLAAPSESLARAAALTPTGRLTEPNDVAAAVRFLLSEEAAQITGQSIHVDGGLLLG